MTLPKSDNFLKPSKSDPIKSFVDPSHLGRMHKLYQQRLRSLRSVDEMLATVGERPCIVGRRVGGCGGFMGASQA